MNGCIADTAFRARDGVDQGQQPLNSAMLACGYHPHSRGYTGQQELISSWKTLPLKEAKPSAEISQITGLCETTSPADSGQQQGTLKPLRFQSQDTMAFVSQPCRVPLKTSTCPLNRMASPNLLRTLLWLHRSQDTAKVCTFLTTKKGTEQVCSDEIFCLGAHKWSWKGWGSWQTINANLKHPYLLSMWVKLPLFLPNHTDSNLDGIKTRFPTDISTQPPSVKGSVLKGTQSLQQLCPWFFYWNQLFQMWDVFSERQPTAS